MIPRSPARLLAALAVLLLPLPLVAQTTQTTPAGSTPQPLPCALLDSGYSCEVSLPRTPGVSETPKTLVTDATGAEVDAAFTAGRAGRVLMLLVDTSNPKREPLLAHGLDQLRSLVAQVPEGTLIGLARFDENLTVLREPTADRDVVLQSISELKADGQNTHLYEALLDALTALPAAPAGRSDIVVFSDGNAEDQSFSLADVSTRARAADVRISGLGAVLRTSELGYTQSLERLSEETGGVYSEAPAGSADFPPADLTAIANLGEGGGTLVLPQAPATDLTLELTWENGRSETFAIPAVAEAEVLPEAPLVPVWAWGIGAILLLILAALLLRGRKQAEPVQVVMPAPPAPEPEPSAPLRDFGTLTSAEGHVYPLTSSVITVGRTDDAEVQLINDSVSRRHATISVSEEGTLRVTDLESTNGVFINGKKITSGSFSDGDTLTFGEVKLVYAAPAPAAPWQGEPDDDDGFDGDADGGGDGDG